MENNIVIISDNKETADNLVAKISLLRTSDSIDIINSKKISSKFSHSSPDLIIFCLNNNDDFEIIKRLKTMQALKNTPVIILVKNFEPEILCDAFDSGVDDFISEDENGTQILIKIMWKLRQAQILKELNKKNDILVSLEVIDKESGFYTKNFTKKIFRYEFNALANRSPGAIFMILSAGIKYKNIISQSFLASVIKKSLRRSDIVGFSDDNKFYIILRKTDKDGANIVYEKINRSLKPEYCICAAACTINSDSFEKTEEFLNTVLADALMKESSYLYKNFKDGSCWIDRENTKETNFKMFKELFMDKFTKIAAPVFFRMQTIYQNKLFETDIEQYINENESYFCIKNNQNKCCLKIKYPGYSKINITSSCIKEGGNHNKRLSLNMDELTSQKLEELINILAEDFQKEN